MTPEEIVKVWSKAQIGAPTEPDECETCSIGHYSLRTLVQMAQAEQREKDAKEAEGHFSSSGFDCACPKTYGREIAEAIREQK